MKKIALLLAVLLSFAACKNSEDKSELPVAEKEADSIEMNEPLKLSLAQWSLHKRYQDEGGNPLKFPTHAKDEFGIEAVELVSQLYNGKIEEHGFQSVVDSLKENLEQSGVQCLLIMVDNEGDLADPDESKRNEAVDNHKKWVDAANLLGAHSVRVNAFGSNDPEVWKETLRDGLTKLSAYAATKGINVLVENHGWLSSDPELLMEVMNEVDMDNCGTLPDFGNWCLKRKDGSRWGECVEEYPDYYKGVALLMPKAKAVSAKSYNFDEEGNETKLDYYKMLDIVTEAGYQGYIGIEYEGDEMDEVSGINATKELLKKAYN